MAKSFSRFLGGLWKIQYAPRERLIKNSLNKKSLSKWNKLRTTQKIVIIDKLQKKGVFGG